MIQINNLSHLYPNAEKNALSAVNFDIESASTIGLLGPNGAGKTTLMSLLAGLQSVQQGEIYFDGVPFAKLCDKLVLLNEGNLIYQGSVQGILEEGQSLERFYLDFLNQAGKTC